jgi:GH15 family glucan-1,4-alpha-glucosidase
MNNLDYGIIGNCRSAALISKTASIDWCCLPEFNSSSIFAKLLDKQIGGSFEFIVDKNYQISQKYIPNTNMLLTEFKKSSDHFNVIDFMPRYKADDNSHHYPPDIIRYIKYKSGNPTFRIKYNPRLEYAIHPTESIINSQYIKSFTTKGAYDSLYLYTNLDKEKILNQQEIKLQNNAFCLISYNQKIEEQTQHKVYIEMQRTKVYWLDWAERTRHTKKYYENVLRSALVLKLLSYHKTGAVLAAVTTSLPETIGEIRNWDYRFCWLRDASMVIKVMTNLGHYNVAKRFLKFIVNVVPDKDQKIQIMYGIGGETRLTEKILAHLSGYENSRPVRIGNAAYRQKQNDIYGISMDVVYQHFQLVQMSVERRETMWTITRSIVRIVQRNWRKKDKGIWEIRSEEKHFTFSKVLCWVAIDRAIKIAELLNMNEYLSGWTELAMRIKKDIFKNAWNERIGAFTQSYGSDDMDASNLLMELYGFIDAGDPKYIGTVKVTREQLCKDGLMYRYKNKDDFGLPSSSFTICTFWLIKALYKIGEKKEAVILFEQLLSYSNHLGLFSEDIDFKTKRLLGNFPQGYSHLALIETAILLSEHEDL